MFPPDLLLILRMIVVAGLFAWTAQVIGKVVLHLYLTGG